MSEGKQKDSNDSAVFQKLYNSTKHLVLTCLTPNDLGNLNDCKPFS
jgi:hypothetical protein